jgi:hypothetical protein
VEVCRSGGTVLRDLKPVQREEDIKESNQK